MRVRRQIATGELDARAIEARAAGRERDEHRQVPVLGDADRRGLLYSSSCHASSRAVFVLVSGARLAEDLGHERMLKGG